MVESQLPKIVLADLEELKNSAYTSYSAENVNEMTNFLTNYFLNSVLM